MTDILEYDDLKLRIEAGDGDSYRVVAFGPGGNTATGGFARPISQVELDNFILRVGLPRRHVRKYRSSQMEEAKQLGTQLFESLLAEDVGDLYHGARSVADSRNRGLRVTLYLTGVPELMEIPWEFLYDPGDAFFLSQSMYTPLVRSLDLRSASPPRKLTLPMKVLGMASAPQGFRGTRRGRRAREARARSRAAHLARCGGAGVARLGHARGARPPRGQSGRTARDPLHRPRCLRRPHAKRHPGPRGQYGWSSRGDRRGARRAPTRRAQPAAGGPELVRGRSDLARGPVFRGCLEPAALRASCGGRDAGGDHRRGGDHVLRAPLHGPGPGLPDRRRADPGAQGDLRRRQRRGIRHPRALPARRECAALRRRGSGEARGAAGDRAGARAANRSRNRSPRSRQRRSHLRHLRLRHRRGSSCPGRWRARGCSWPLGSRSRSSRAAEVATTRGAAGVDRETRSTLAAGRST